MRVHRLALVATWITVSLLVVVGFANFSVSNPQTGAAAPNATYAPGVGDGAGAVSAMAFAYGSDSNLVAQARPAPVEIDTTTEESAESPKRSSTTFIRTTVLNESAVREIAAEFFPPEDVATAIRSAWCASSFDPNYQNSETGAAGLFQISAEQWAEYAPQAGVSEIVEPRSNTAVAAWIVENSSGSWSSLVCNGQ